MAIIDKQLTIIIATMMQHEMLEQCLGTLRHHAPYDCTVWVVDNNEDPEPQARVGEIVGANGVGVIHSGVNRKAMGAFNLGLAVVESPYVAFLHDDAAFIPGSHDFWPRLLSIARHDEVGMCGPSISNCTGLQHFLRWDMPEVHETEYLYGACMMFKTDWIRGIGGMCEDVTPADDIELAVRTRKLGKKIVIDRRCFIMHHRHKTYSLTRPAAGDVTNLEASFNKIIKRHGVSAVMDHLFAAPDWSWIKQTCPTHGEMLKRLEMTMPAWRPNGQ